MRNRTGEGKLSTYLLVCSVALVTLAIELLQTRILSALFYSHVVYLTITVALLGFGISGVVVSIFAREPANTERIAWVSAGAFAVSSVVCMRAASFTPVLLPANWFFSKLLFCYVVLAVPFLFSGMVLGVIFMSGGRNIYRLYFFDLAASALGVLGFTLLLRPLGADLLIWVLAGIVAVSHVIYGWRIGAPRWALPIVPAILLTGYGIWGSDLVNDQPEKSKASAAAYVSPPLNGYIEKSEWTTIAKIDLVGNPITLRLRPSAGLLRSTKSKVLTQDGDAHTIMLDSGRVNKLLRGPRDRFRAGRSLLYFARPAPENALVIGVGGGLDMVHAEAFGAKFITGIEINKAIIDVAHEYEDLCLWPKWKNVSLVWAEGRHFISRTKEKYDTIAMTAIDTFTALNSGAYVMSENYLYTVEAFGDYLRVLKPDGVMSIVRLFFRQPRESLRLVNLYLYAAERAGIDPSRSIFVYSIRGERLLWSGILFKKTPFTTQEMDRILEAIKPHPKLSALYIPNVFPSQRQKEVESAAFQSYSQDLSQARRLFASLLRGPSKASRKEMEDEYIYNISPVYDDSPFFFRYGKLGRQLAQLMSGGIKPRAALAHLALLFLLIVVGAACLLAMIGPLMVYSRDGLHVTGRWSLIGFFSCLGVGFMFLEIGFIQRLNLYLGHPMISLSVVLAGLLLFTGIGSLRAARMKGGTLAMLRKGMLGTAFSALACLAILPWLIPATLAWPTWSRIVMSLLMLLPMGLFMGIPFATGLRYLESRHPRFIPWAWGINGLMSVMASILAIAFAMRIGFTMVIVLGALVYLFGYGLAAVHLAQSWDRGSR